MRKPTKNQLPTIFSIYAEDKKGLVGQVLVHFNKKNYEVISLNVARTDISDLVMLTLEAIVPAPDLLPFAERIKKIVEVYAVQTFGDSLKNGFLQAGQRSADEHALVPDREIWCATKQHG